MRPRPMPPAPALSGMSMQKPEWGLQARIEGALLGSKANANSGMAGAGMSIRPRPSPYFALDLGVDYLAGRDWHGLERAETSFSVNPVFFLTPRHQAQLYILTGFHISTAKITPNSHEDFVGTRGYNYFGLNGGVGLEIRFALHWAIDGELVGFIRSRTDRSARSDPEFVDQATGRTTNTSGGGLLRLGLTYYW